jgi:hypothetical protein
MRAVHIALLFLTWTLHVGCGAELNDETTDSGFLSGTPASPANPNLGVQPEFCSRPDVEVSPGDMWSITGPRYHLLVGSSWSRKDAEHFGVLLESAWLGFEYYFDAPAVAQDGGLLEVYMFDDESQWAQALTDDGLGVPWGAGGYFHPSTERAYLWRQPERYTNRMLLLHEAIHQFHHLSVQTAAQSAWFIEGLAEYLSRHDWYDGCIRLGTVPTGTLENAHGVALDRWTDGTLDVDRLVDDPALGQRPDAMAWYAFLEESYPEELVALRAVLDAGASNEAEAFKEQFGAPTDHQEPFGQWLRDHQEPLTIVYTGWEHLDQQHMQAHAAGTGYLTFAPLKSRPERFAVTVQGVQESFSGGVLVSYEDEATWSVVIGNERGEISALHYGAEGGIWDNVGSVSASTNSLSFDYSVTDQQTEMNIGGETLTYEHSQQGAAGLGVYDSDVIFEWEP